MRTDSLDIAGDSQGYHLLAVNLLNGLGYCPHPVAGHEYDEFTTSLVNLAPEPARFEPLRVPGYPLALAGIYQLFGVSSLTILRYQQLLAGFSAMALGVGAWRLAGWRGLVAAAASVFLLSTNAEGSYSISMLLSECQTESLMALSFALSAMSDRVPGTHTLCGLAIASAVLTRPGCLCIAAVYFAFLIHHRVPGRWRQIVSFGLVVGLWSAIATYQSGRPVVLTSNTGTV
ncbi:MAG: hypothetical protein KDA75_08215, partial [Planctomycetaceae bacterium]|nr:hypothetical protein [Planctomycetaceae bacterium]